LTAVGSVLDTTIGFPVATNFADISLGLPALIFAGAIADFTTGFDTGVVELGFTTVLDDTCFAPAGTVSAVLTAFTTGGFTAVPSPEGFATTDIGTCFVAGCVTLATGFAAAVVDFGPATVADEGFDADSGGLPLDVLLLDADVNVAEVVFTIEGPMLISLSLLISLLLLIAVL
jgi:hypothetical protein